ncbi:uncharacterized protein AC631_03189 [Debaryomyces fabryi]|uniref:Uncharacterized protein n=1 Tax=Debaryomyces fabryi TaxID=58627 RepID=A0A0V1PXU7_9ASCO|nr:uncharacterized protein AC631_03189 [Debaryomyces fabryi]KSA01065.1 hypothetical protein AC631_03189 [Debaryomyces fabryi]CUM47658.1 unnamed protein product [Debaryomyces fabryi]
MSHPAASVKSIFSGKMNIDTPDELDPYEYSNNNSYDNFSQNDIENDDISSKLSQESNYSVNSKNLKALASMQPNGKTNENQFYNQNSFTNVSIVSSGSDYQQNYVSSSVNSPNVALSAESMEEMNHNLGPFESYSRPLSRNSTTSCLSTTATKDGIEGKKLHRHGPTQYSSNIIANMIQNSNLYPPPPPPPSQHMNKHSYTNSGMASPPIRPYGQKSSMTNSPMAEQDRDGVSITQSSIKSTNAEVDGETEDKKNINIERYPNSIPPVTLNEKINLLNTDPINHEQ